MDQLDIVRLLPIEILLRGDIPTFPLPQVENFVHLRFFSLKRI